MNIASLSISQSRSIYLLITPSGITANLVPLGTSMITNGIRQDLRFNPGEYSIDLDDDHFNASNGLMIIIVESMVWLIFHIILGNY